jgi:hypothetical protein
MKNEFEEFVNSNIMKHINNHVLQPNAAFSSKVLTVKEEENLSEEEGYGDGYQKNLGIKLNSSLKDDLSSRNYGTSEPNLFSKKTINIE